MVPPILQPRRTLALMTLATIAIFGGLVATITWQLRGRLRAEVLRREAEAIHAVALMHLQRGETRLAEFGAEFVIDDLFAAVLESSKLRGVIAVQLFDARGQLREASTIPPEDAEKSRWWPDDLAEPSTRFTAKGLLEWAAPKEAMEAMRRGEAARLPLLEIAVPLTAKEKVVARYWLHGGKVAEEFARMDRGLAAQAGIAFAGGAVLVACVLAWSFSRLAEANRRLVEQSVDLARANEELDFAAKTGALGAISAHLIHGLKNPLAGIEGFVSETASGAPDASRGDACRKAVETTQRLRALVTEVSTVLRDEADGAADYPVPITEVIEAALARARPAAEQAGVVLGATAEAGPELRARVANLVGLVLANVITNAIEAAPGGLINVEGRGSDGSVEIFVRDTGPGIPAEMQVDLFRPRRSTKRGGGGVGLAISLRLARHAGGNLELLRSDGTGTEFRLTVPAAGTDGKPSHA